MAVDATPYPIDFTNIPRQTYFIGFVLGVAKLLLAQGVIEYEMRSGLDWDGDTYIRDTNFVDRPHFQIIKPRR